MAMAVSAARLTVKRRLQSIVPDKGKHQRAWVSNFAQSPTSGAGFEQQFDDATE
jgi:hypothetical protein